MGEVSDLVLLVEGATQRGWLLRERCCLLGQVWLLLHTLSCFSNSWLTSASSISSLLAPFLLLLVPRSTMVLNLLCARICDNVNASLNRLSQAWCCWSVLNCLCRRIWLKDEASIARLSWAWCFWLVFTCLKIVLISCLQKGSIIYHLLQWSVPTVHSSINMTNKLTLDL